MTKRANKNQNTQASKITQEIKQSKLPLILSICANIVLALTFSYGVIYGERGPMFGKPKPTIQVGHRVGIANEITSESLFIKLSINNFGTAPLHIAPIQLFVSKKRGKVCKLLNSSTYTGTPSSSWYELGYFTVETGGNWSYYVSFVERTDPAEDLDESELLLDIMESQQNKFIDDPEKASSEKLSLYEIDKSILDRIEERLKQNISWLDEGEFQVLLTIRSAGDDSKIYFRSAYGFTVKRELIKRMYTLQAKDYLHQGLDAQPFTRHWQFWKLSSLKRDECNQLIELEKRYKQSMSN